MSYIPQAGLNATYEAKANKGVADGYASLDGTGNVPLSQLGNAPSGTGGTPASTVTGPDAYGAAAVVGTSTDFARADHDHGLPAVPTAAAVGAVPTSEVGAASGVASLDATGNVPASQLGNAAAPATTVSGPDAFGASAAVGTSTDYARADHDHGLPAAPYLDLTPPSGGQTVEMAEAADQEYAVRFVRNASYTGGTAAFVSSPVRIETTVGAGVADYQWGLTSVLTNSATGGQNVAVYAQGNRETTGTGPTWAMVAEAHDHSGAGNQSSGLIGIEVDVIASGDDTTNNRVGVHVVSGMDSGGTAMHAAYGVWVDATAANSAFYNGVQISGSVATGVHVSCTGTVGIDVSGATLSGAALKISRGQTIAFEATGTLTVGDLGATDNLLRFQDGGATLLSLDLSTGLFHTIAANEATGSGSAALGANCPATTPSAPHTWEKIVTSDGSTGYIPVWK